MIGEREKRPVYPLGYSRGIQGRQGPRGSDPLFLDQTEARKAENFFLETGLPRLSQDLDPALGYANFIQGYF